MSKLDVNTKIMAKLFMYFVENPEIRFWQGLYNLGIITGKTNDGVFIVDDKHHEESSVTLDNLD